MTVAQLAAASSSTTPWWADSITVAWVAIVVAVLAAAFAGWQAWLAYAARRATTDRALVEWLPAEWTGPETIEVRSAGPDDARHAWGRVTIDSQPYTAFSRRVRAGEALRFTVPALRPKWEDAEARKPQPGRISIDLNVFEYGVLVTWKSRYGTPGEHRWFGMMMRRMLDPTPAPVAAFKPDQG